MFSHIYVQKNRQKSLGAFKRAPTAFGVPNHGRQRSNKGLPRANRPVAALLAALSDRATAQKPASRNSGPSE